MTVENVPLVRETPLCKCGRPASRLMSQSMKNHGRIYFKCLDCKFFEWETEDASVTPAAPRPVGTPPAILTSMANPSLPSIIMSIVPEELHL